MRAATLLATLLAALALTTSAAAEDPARCGDAGYSYAGVAGLVPADGARATVRVVSTPQVESGHVAAWVGFGGHGAGSGGTSAWLQTGVISRPEHGPTLYYEVAQPGKGATMTLLGPAVPGRAYRLRVSELRPGFWQAFVDGTPVSPAFFLPGSHGNWEATATAESWDGDQVVCNRFAFAFERVQVLRTGTWQPFTRRVSFQSPGYRVAPAADGFTATG